MKIYSALALTFVVILFITSCTKYRSEIIQRPARTIRFQLHTEADVSDDNKNITFSVYIRTHGRVLFDSTLAPMRIKDIPDSAHKIVFDKKVPNDDGSDLGVGFHYAIENVGTSSHPDTCSAAELLKVVDFSFH